MIVVVGRVRTDAERRADLLRIAPPDVSFHTVERSRNLGDMSRG